MKILNVGAGGCRPQGEEWWNLDNLRTQLPPGSGARQQLDSEPRYVEHDLSRYQMPFNDDQFDGILLAHCLEHFPAQKGVALMEDCRRMLKPEGVLLVSVPDASYFRKVYDRDENKNWQELFDTTDPQNPIPTFFRAALWFEQHDVILTEDALWGYFVRAGFDPRLVESVKEPVLAETVLQKMHAQLDRLKFSLVMAGVKS
jgi:predicted SAM-dependent methyltransferase